MGRVLVIEDHQPLARSLKRGLQEEGFVVDIARDGQEGEDRTRSADYDVIILDLILPREDGLSLLGRWRQEGLNCHVLILTARSSTEDKVRGLDQGADDYLTKPFVLTELVARLRALLRRSHQVQDPVLRAHDLEINTRARTVRRGGRTIHLTPYEYALLELLAQQRGRVVSRRRIEEHLFKGQDPGPSNVLNVHIGHLRSKIDKGFDPPLILTRRRQGYLLRGDPT